MAVGSVAEFVCRCFFFKQKTAYEMRISDWSSDVCSSDLGQRREQHEQVDLEPERGLVQPRRAQALHGPDRSLEYPHRTAREMADFVRHLSTRQRCAAGGTLRRDHGRQGRILGSTA